MPVEFWLVVPACASTAPMTMELTAYVWPVTTAAKIVRVRLHFHVEPVDPPTNEPSWPVNHVPVWTGSMMLGRVSVCPAATNA